MKICYGTCQTQTVFWEAGTPQIAGDRVQRIDRMFWYCGFACLAMSLLGALLLIDAEVAYSFVRRRKPRRLIEVGSGNSTLVFAAATRKNAKEGFEGEFIAIEPCPAPFLKDGLPGLTQLIQKPVQQAPFDLFRRLEADDILFIDSSHAVSMDSDVLYECLRILPQLAPGVLVHFHDIFAPLDYPEEFVKTNLCFWGEQYMLEAFLSFNTAFKVVWSGSAMQQFHPDVLKRAFPAWEGSFRRMPEAMKVFAPSLDGKNVWPCSLWIERTDWSELIAKDNRRSFDYGRLPRRTTCAQDAKS